MKSAITIHAKATVSSKGQVVIPKQLRHALGLHSGSELLFELHEGNLLAVKLIKGSIQNFFGRAKQVQSNPLSLNEIDQTIMQAVIDNDTESR